VPKVVSFVEWPKARWPKRPSYSWVKPSDICNC